ncbi:MAG: dual specificity protein phosphatase family protein [Candidatus Caldarchaeum sp.]|nr:dual specificity protein phosphatase family protein [Candidatus Caldarchaeum sp.]
MPGTLRKIQGFFLDRPPNFSEFNDNIVASGLPSQKKHMRYLKNRGVSAIISLTENPLPKELADDFAYFHFPLKDHQPAHPSSLLEIVKKLEELCERGHKVLVHCQAGYGRTGMVLTAYTMWKKRLGWRAALDVVRSVRPGSVEAGQEKSLREFEELVKAGS